MELARVHAAHVGTHAQPLSCGHPRQITMVAREESETASHEKAREESETATENMMLVFEYWKFASRFLTHSFVDSIIHSLTDFGNHIPWVGQWFVTVFTCRKSPGLRPASLPCLTR
ncbi:hypothetical protein JG688_00014911 [Phytophthora aleatoria]|uniref:Uncharacterized protein n=1 Tax=Phytophthora aleatoria TaxID=2496075 RepID=A0A8J5I6P3_9STRA|nr:hypothetical protein JG688_00014911 [Phytophthora aleatoria]